MSALLLDTHVWLWYAEGVIREVGVPARRPDVEPTVAW